MGLDATVFCNCFETGKLKELPHNVNLVSVSSDGSLDYKSEDLDTLIEFDEWLFYRACEHENGILLHHRIGNVMLVSLLRGEISRKAEKFPVTLRKILYSGSHAGDYLSLDIVESLEIELDYLGEFVCSSERNQQFINYFRQQLIELVKASLQAGKPISF